MILETIQVPLTEEAQLKALDEGYILEPYRNHAGFHHRYVMGVRPAPYQATMAQYVEAACEVFGVSREELIGGAVDRMTFRARAAGMWACRKAGYSSPQVGKRFNRDHSTVLVAVKRCKAMQQRDMGYRRACERLLVR